MMISKYEQTYPVQSGLLNFCSSNPPKEFPWILPTISPCALRSTGIYILQGTMQHMQSRDYRGNDTYIHNDTCAYLEKLGNSPVLYFCPIIYNRFPLCMTIKIYTSRFVMLVLHTNDYP